jgi:1,4-alpha-glucan branching enzyme
MTVRESGTRAILKTNSVCVAPASEKKPDPANMERIHMSKAVKNVKNMKKSAVHLTAAAKREVAFVLSSHEAEEVYLCGDFNQWIPYRLPMIRHGDNRWWEKRLVLAPGRYEYKFVVDGEWIHDPRACNSVPNAHGSLNSVVEVKL